MKKNFELIVAGVGGQGSVLAARIIGDAALRENLAVRIGDTFGAAIRGGPVHSHVRIGTNVRAPLIMPHNADVIVGLEFFESVRIALTYLSPSGTLLMNTHQWMPVDVNVGKAKPLNINETQKELRNIFSEVIAFDATSIAEGLGEPRAVNSVMLGALSAIDKIPINVEKFKEAIEARMPKRVIKVNLEAFNLGYQKIIKKG